MPSDTVSRLEEIWNKRSSDGRSNWIWKAGFTKEAVNKYRDLQWASLPIYVRETLENQES